ncbi:MAG TPA: S9 family peptidase [Candidatus Saccharimonadales bacterium]|nr:S9 family peptidase [Candidatus Saccharimonadales bacterium]
MRRTVLFLCATLALAVTAAPALAAAETHLFSVHDMLAMDRISDPQVSPDGEWIAFVVRTTDLEADKGRTDLWLVPAAGGPLRRLTTNEASDSSPRWSRDGRDVYFLSTRSGSSQVWRIARDGGEATQVTSYPLDVENLLLASGADRMAVTMQVFVDCDTLDCTKKRLDETAARKSTGRLYDHLFIRHWDTWSDGRRSHLFVTGLDGADPVDVTSGMDADVPSKPFGGTEEFTFTPDGEGVVFTARVAGREEAWSTNFDLYLAPVNGHGAPRNLTAENAAWDTNPVFSPDGHTMAYLAMTRPGFESDRFRIVLRSWPEGETRVLTEGWDRSPSSLVWSADGRTIYATAENLGQRSLFAVDASRGRVAVVVRDGTVRAVATAGPRIVYAMDSLQGPTELYSVDAMGSDPQRITHVNDEKVAAARMGEPEQFKFKGWNGEEVYGYVVKPADFDPAKKYPVAFLIHGGPQGSFGNDFHYRWNPQAYAGAGYATVSVDFHGSTGYGQAFQDAIRDDWGGKPLVDLQKGLAAALERNPWMDGDRVCALGASYGAYMINWIAGNWPDRFRCLVTHDGNLDERFAYFDTEELWFPEWEHKGTPWENPEGYEKQNPEHFVGNWKTPTLVVHGGRDFRIPYAEGIAVFTALQRLGIPSEFLFFPDESHWVLKPSNSIQWHDTVIGWLDRWLKKPAGS